MSANWSGNFSGSFSRVEEIAHDGMVVSAHPLASLAGVKIMKKGGNAIDAAVATAFALGVVEPYMTGIGGGCLMVVHTYEEDFIINSEEVTPINSRPDMFEVVKKKVISGSESESEIGVKNDENLKGYKAVAVPGMVAGFYETHSRFGILPWEDVLEPAINYAEEGFIVDRYFASYVAGGLYQFQEFKEITSIFLKDGILPSPPVFRNMKIVQKDLANTMKKIAKDGESAFYKGEIAKMIAEDMEINGGLISEEDLANFKPRIIEPRPGSYRGYKIIAVPGSGGTEMIEILNILENFDLKNLGHNSAKYIHLLAETLKIEQIDSSKYATDDPDKMPLDMLESKEYAKEISEKIGSYEGKPTPLDEEETTHFSVVDKDRNMVSCTFSLGSYFGSKVVVPKTGVILNNHMKEFNPIPGTPTSIEPGKRRWTGKNPFIAFKRNAPFLAMGSPSLGVPNVTQVFLNIVDFGMGIQEAIEAPRIGTRASKMIYDYKPYEEKIVVDHRIGKQVFKELKDRGYDLLVTDIDLNPAKFARPSGILIDDEGVLHGGHHSISLPYGSIIGYEEEEKCL